MEERDFYWCFNHESLFREWLCPISFYNSLENPHFRLDNDGFFNLWQEAKKYALEIANSKDPVLFYWTKMDYWIAESRRHIFWLSDSCQQASLLLKFLNSMLASSKNKKLELFADIGDNVFIDYVIKWKKDPNSKFELDTKPFYGMIHPLLMPGQIESDYDYSLPDGGITETITKTITKVITKTKTKTETETDETKTETDETETEEESVDVILPKYNALNDVDFISAMQKAIEIGWIEEIEDSRYKWIGPTLIGTKKIKGYSNAALAYFIAKALKIKMELKPDNSLTKDSKGSIKNNFPPINDIKEVFGEEIKRQQLEDALERKNVQVWREPIDEFFKDIYNFIGN